MRPVELHHFIQACPDRRAAIISFIQQCHHGLSIRPIIGIGHRTVFTQLSAQRPRIKAKKLPVISQHGQFQLPVRSIGHT
jgi:hypothetical protein